MALGVAPVVGIAAGALGGQALLVQPAQAAVVAAQRIVPVGAAIHRAGVLEGRDARMQPGHVAGLCTQAPVRVPGVRGADRRADRRQPLRRGRGELGQSVRVSGGGLRVPGTLLVDLRRQPRGRRGEAEVARGLAFDLDAIHGADGRDADRRRIGRQRRQAGDHQHQRRAQHHEHRHHDGQQHGADARIHGTKPSARMAAATISERRFHAAPRLIPSRIWGRSSARNTQRSMT